MSAPAKFLFNVDFGSGRDQPTEQAISQAALELAVAEAEARGHRTGYAAARADIAAESERRTAAALEQIAGALAALTSGLHQIEQRLEAEAVEVAHAVGAKLASELISREPFAEIAALAAHCFDHVIGAPHVVVRINDALYADAHERLAEIARLRGFDGRVVVLAEPDVALGDCRIEWADGGLNRDRAKAQAAINEAVAAYVAVRRPVDPDVSRRHAS
ncbi:MAG: flagellar assembly protein FliH [Xanthobacteraceae bacterium]